MNTIRDNMKQLIQELLITKAMTSEEQAYEWACGIAERMGLDSIEGDQIGTLACVILTTCKGMTTLYHKPTGLPVVWMDVDRIRRDGVNSVEVF